MGDVLVTSLDELIAKPQLTIIYDGECPFCSSYVTLLRIRQNVGSVDLLDARKFPELVSDLCNRGFMLDEGMIVIYERKMYFADDAIHVLSMLSTGSGFFNKLVAVAFRKQSRAAVIYPALRSCRNLTLKILGRTLIQPPTN
jgi:hypothetical protein